MLQDSTGLRSGASDHPLISFISCNALFPKQSRPPLLPVWNSVLFLYLLQVTPLFWRNNPPSLFSWWDSGSANSTPAPREAHTNLPGLLKHHQLLANDCSTMGMWPEKSQQDPFWEFCGTLRGENHSTLRFLRAQNKGLKLLTTFFFFKSKLNNSMCQEWFKESVHTIISFNSYINPRCHKIYYMRTHSLEVDRTAFEFWLHHVLIVQQASCLNFLYHSFLIHIMRLIIVPPS